MQILKISHENTFYFLRYVHVRYIKSMLRNIQKQQNLLEISLIFTKFTNFTGKQLVNSQDQECEIFKVLFLYEHKNLRRSASEIKSALMYLEMYICSKSILWITLLKVILTSTIYIIYFSLHLKDMLYVLRRSRLLPQG